VTREDIRAIDTATVQMLERIESATPDLFEEGGLHFVRGRAINHRYKLDLVGLFGVWMIRVDRGC